MSDHVLYSSLQNKESKMGWTSYPHQQPEKDGEYLVSIGDYVTIARFEKYTKLYDQFDNKYFAPMWNDICEGGLHKNVTAFMKKPFPYKGE